MLDDAYILECEQRARRFSGAFTGTSGSLAAAVLLLIKDRREIMRTLEESNRMLRDAVAARMAASDQAAPQNGVTETLPKNFSAAGPVKIVGLAGHINSGKSLVAGMIPGAHHLQWADPIYRGLAAMLGVPEDVLRDRTQKDEPMSVNGVQVTPRLLARTLGTEWGRQQIHKDLWVALTFRTLDAAAASTGCRVFSICGTRFPNEVWAIRDRGGEVWWIDRPGTQLGWHQSDQAISAKDCDRVIVNNGSIDGLRENVERAFSDFASREAAA